MRRFWPLLIFAVIFAIAFFYSQQPITAPPQTTKAQRIISLAPSITEILFALGLDRHIIAVTDYCDYPPQAQSLPKTGGLLNPNLEKIIALAPDLVILQAGQTRLNTQLQQLGIITLAVKNTRYQDILDAIDTIGKATSRQQQAQSLIARIQHQVAAIAARVAAYPRPRVLLVLGHSLSSDTINTIYVAGQHDFYHDLIQLAGGRNAYQDTTMKVPVISIEGILQLDPDIIIDVFPDADDHHADIAQTLQRWQTLHTLKAVKNHRVYIIEKDYATIPGPRIGLLLHDLAVRIHPEINSTVPAQ